MTFRLPFVSRDRHDATLRLLEDLRQDEKMRESIAIQRAMEWQDALEHERSRYADLLERYHMLKLQGFAEPVPVPSAPPRREPDPIKQAIAAKAGSNRALRAQMERQAAQDEAAGMSKEEIALNILNGVQIDHAVNL